MQRRDQNWCVFFFCISNNVIWLIMLPEIIKFRSNRIWIYFPYNCYEGQKVDTILNGGVVWTRPVYKSEINIDGWAKLTGMVASDGLWQPPPAWGCLAGLHTASTLSRVSDDHIFWLEAITSQSKKLSFQSDHPQGDLSSIQAHTWNNNWCLGG